MPPKVDTTENALTSIPIDALVAALRAAVGNDDDSLKKRAEYEAEAHRRLNKRENETHPGKSVYSYPEGDVARPKPELKCKMFWVGYPVQVENLTPEEIDGLNRATPGEYGFTKTDGSPSKLTVKAQTDHTGAFTQLEFLFPCRGDNRHNLPSMVSMLREVFGGGVSELDLLKAEVERLKAQTAA